MNTQLEGEHTQLLQFLYACPVGLAEVAPEGEILMINPMAMQFLLPIARTPMIVNFFDIIEAYAPELRNMVDAFEGAQGSVCEAHRIFIRPGADEWGYEAKVLSCTLVKLSPERFILTLTDISKQVDHERRLKQAETWFASLLDGVNDFAVLSLDANGRIDRTNPSFLRQTGFSEAQVLGETLDMFELPPVAAGTLSTQEQIAIACRDGWYLTEGEQRRANGSRYWGQRLIAVRHVTEGTDGQAMAGYTVVLRDVTRQHADAEKLTRILRTDHLTSASNRMHFFETAERECKRAKRYHQDVALICIDIDHFKQVNDTYGHVAGDEVLRVFSRICMQVLRPSDLFARLGGEEFVALLPSTDLAGAMQLAERLRSVIADTTIEAGGQRLTVSASFGCAALTAPSGNVTELLSAADEALYRAKRTGRDRVVGSAQPALVGEAK